VSVNGGSPEVQNIGPTYPGCVQLDAFQIECSVPIDAPTGSDTFSVDLFDQAGGGGNILGLGTATGDVRGVPSDVITVDIHGVVSSIEISVPSGYSRPASMKPHEAQLGGPLNCGASRSLPLTVKGYDADKNLITGGITYYNPITLSGDSALALEVQWRNVEQGYYTDYGPNASRFATLWQCGNYTCNQDSPNGADSNGVILSSVYDDADEDVGIDMAQAIVIDQKHKHAK
jgi:hypothetical protein